MMAKHPTPLINMAINLGVDIPNKDWGTLTLREIESLRVRASEARSEWSSKASTARGLYDMASRLEEACVAVLESRRYHNRCVQEAKPPQLSCPGGNNGS